jgi:hypothetical protein
VNTFGGMQKLQHGVAGGQRQAEKVKPGVPVGGRRGQWLQRQRNNMRRGKWRREGSHMPATAPSQFPSSCCIQSMAHTPAPRISSEARQPWPRLEGSQPMARTSHAFTVLQLWLPGHTLQRSKRLPVVATGQEHLAAAGGISCIGCAAEECDPSLVRAHREYGGGRAAAVPQLERAVVCARHEHVVVQPCAAPCLGRVRPVRDKHRCERRLRVNHCDSAAGGDA